mgnify:CR=1 FL=1
MSNTKYISSLSEYLHVIEVLRFHYPNTPLLQNPAADTFLFRGLPNSSYSLLPTILRSYKYGFKDHIVENELYTAWANELEILKSFICEASAYLKIPATNYCQWLEYAQHYGVPTRLLDWTSNPLVALFFACRSNHAADAKVWILHQNNYRNFLRANISAPEGKTISQIIGNLLANTSSIKFPFIYTPYYVDTRMSAQSSYFMVWGTEKVALDNVLSSEARNMQFKENNDSRTYGTHEGDALSFIVYIHADQKQPLLRELDSAGVNEKTLFPGLDGIGRDIEQKYRFVYDETVRCF